MENVWIKARKRKPDDDEEYLVKDRDHNKYIARYDSEDRLWRTEDWQVIDVVVYMAIPDEDE